MRSWALTSALWLAGCGAAGSGPVIDDVQMPVTAVVGSDGFFTLDGVISFHDDGGLVDKIRIFIPLVAQTYEFSSTAGLQRGTAPLEVKFSGVTPRGPIAYDVSLVDAAGGVSEPRHLTVELR